MDKILECKNPLFYQKISTCRENLVSLIYTVTIITPQMGIQKRYRDLFCLFKKWRIKRLCGNGLEVFFNEKRPCYQKLQICIPRTFLLVFKRGKIGDIFVYRKLFLKVAKVSKMTRKILERSKIKNGLLFKTSKLFVYRNKRGGRKYIKKNKK